MPLNEKEIFKEEFEKKLRDKLDEEILRKLKGGVTLLDDDLRSIDYEKFRKENLPTSLNFYENICHISEKLLNIKPDKKTYEKIEAALEESHLQCTPTGVQSSSILISLIFFLIGSILILIAPILGFGILIISLIAYYFLMKIPNITKGIYKAKANDQMILAVFYIVSFMRFNPNLELATAFAAKYVGPPLSLDFKKMLWKIANQEVPNIKSAFDEYLEKWRDTNIEFLEAIYLIESSLYETEEFRRISMLDKALDIILQSNYEKMLHFSQTLKSKVSTFNMLGIVLPILGLIILPLAASFGDPKSVWQFTIVLYVIIIPTLVWFYGMTLSSGKPAGINSIRIETLNKQKNITKIPIKITKNFSLYIPPIILSLLIIGILLPIGLSPLIIHFFAPTLEKALNNLYLPFTSLSNGKIFDFRVIDKGTTNYTFGPYGFYPTLLSLFVPLSIGLAIGIYLYNKYKRILKIRNKTKQLEKEFPSACFQLGNRITEGISAELAFGVVADSMKDTEAGEFFKIIDNNIKFGGMSIERAIFDEKRGAINNYPSDLIISSMKIIVNSLEQGPEITGKTLIDLSKYLSDMHLAHERLLDLLAEPLGSMKSQKSFLGPVISGIVVSIVFMVTSIMSILKGRVSSIGGSVSSSAGGMMDATSILGDSIPTFLFQIPVGLYMISLILILVYIISSLEEGDDLIIRRYNMGSSLKSSLIKYVLVASIGMVIFAMVAKGFIESM